MNNFDISIYAFKLKREGLFICSSIFCLVALMLGAQEYLSSLNRDTDTLINISGKQRMLSQKLVHQKMNKSKELLDTLNLFKKSQKYLFENSPSKVKQFYSEKLNFSFNNYLSLLNEGTKLKNESLIQLSESVLVDLDKAVELFEMQSNDIQRKLWYTNLFFLVVILFTILLLYFRILKKQRLQIIKTIKRYSFEKSKAMEASRTKSQFLANMSHELRTPLNGVIGITSSLLESEDNIDRKKKLGIVLSTGHLLEQIVNDILEFSKIELSSIQVNKTKFSVENVLEEVLDLVLPVAESKGLYLNLINDIEKPIYVLSDAIKMKQILINLISNGIKFCKVGGVTVNLYTKNNKIIFDIKDTGIGISDKDLCNIFKDFIQVEDTYVKSQVGTGLGLAIAKEFVNALGGEISVVSKVDVGSLFTISLDLEIVDNYEESPSTTHKYFNGNIEKALIVEDNKINQIVIRGMLDKLSISYDLVENGKEAIDIVKKKKYDLILMDISMPIMNGFEATEEIRKVDLNIPIFCMSANTFKEDKEKAFSVGMNEFLSKPLSRNDLVEYLNKYFSIN